MHVCARCVCGTQEASDGRDHNFDLCLAAFFEAGAYHKGKLPWSSIKWLRLQVCICAFVRVWRAND